MTITKVGTATITVMRTEDCDGIGWGDLTLLDMVYVELGVIWWYAKDKQPARVLGKPGGTLHPMDRHARILNALERDHRFEKRYFRCSDNRGRERLMRYFKCFEL